MHRDSLSHCPGTVPGQPGHFLPPLGGSVPCPSPTSITVGTLFGDKHDRR